MKSCWLIIKENKFKSCVIFILTLLISYISYLLPIMQAHIINAILPSNESDKLGQICLILGVLVIIQFICTYNAHILVTKLQYSVVNKLKLEYVDTIKKMDEHSIGKWTHSKLQAKFEEINTVTHIMSISMYKLVGSIIVAIGALTFLIPISLSGTCILVALMPVCYIVNVWSLKAVTINIKDVAESNVTINNRFTDFVSNLNLYKLNLIDNERFRNFSIDINEITSKQIRSTKSQVFAGTVITNFHSLIAALFYFIFGLSVMNNNLSIGDYVAAMQYVHLVYMPITLYATVRLTIAPALVSYHRTQDFIAENKKIKEVNKIEFDKIKTIEILHPNYQNQITSHITSYLVIGEQLNLNDANGSGKSTLLKMLTKQIPIDSGRILINGIDIDEIDRNFLYSHIHYTNQSPQIFNGTVLDNILIGSCYGKDEIDYYIEKYDLFYLTCNIDWNRIITNKNELSLGEQKQIQIFRLLLANKDVYLIDELSASLDKRWKPKVEQILNDKKSDSILISIEHVYKETYYK